MKTLLRILAGAVACAALTLLWFWVYVSMVGSIIPDCLNGCVPGYVYFVCGLAGSFAVVVAAVSMDKMINR